MTRMRIFRGPIRQVDLSDPHRLIGPFSIQSEAGEYRAVDGENVDTWFWVNDALRAARIESRRSGAKWHVSPIDNPPAIRKPI